jgi:DNA-directed RNA polymerase specialized sigma24 family protein
LTDGYEPEAPEPHDEDFDSAFKSEIYHLAMKELDLRLGPDFVDSRRVVQSHVVEGLTVAETAVRLSMTERKVATVLQTTRRQVQRVAQQLLKKACSTPEALRREEARFWGKSEPQEPFTPEG